MPKIIFMLTGGMVQNAGYRLFLLQAMKERGIVGFQTNLACCKQANIGAWRTKHELEDFYEHIKTEKLVGAVKAEVSLNIIGN